MRGASLGITNNFLRRAAPIVSRGEFCPSYLYLEEAADRIKAYRPDIKLLLCLRPPVEMMYSVVLVRPQRRAGEAPRDVRGDDAESLPARPRMLRPPSPAVSRSIFRRRIFWSYNSMRSGAILIASAAARMSFLESIRDFNPSSRKARTKRGLLGFRSSNRARKKSMEASRHFRA